MWHEASLYWTLSQKRRYVKMGASVCRFNIVWGHGGVLYSVTNPQTCTSEKLHWTELYGRVWGCRHSLVSVKRVVELRGIETSATPRGSIIHYISIVKGDPVGHKAPKYLFYPPQRILEDIVFGVAVPSPFTDEVDLVQTRHEMPASVGPFEKFLVHLLSEVRKKKKLFS